jgi:protein-S-isoprenylcysteine O-methyltransferase Ste14
MVVRFSLGFAIFVAVLFLPAGTLKYWQGWAFLATWFVPGITGLGYFYKHDPQFVERRMKRKEKVREQKFIMMFLYMVFAIAFLLPGLDHRFGWSHPPLWLTLVSLALVFGGYMLTLLVMNANRFAASTIQVEPGQTVISTGPYRLLRHPMYFGICVMMLFAPLSLGSYVALPAFVLVVPFVILRLLNEEKFLRQELPGYTEYCFRTRFRLEVIS